MNTKKLIETILRDKPETRDNDKLLILYVWQAKGLRFTPEQVQKFKDMPSPETIRRGRQLLQEKGKYRASEEVEEKRYELYKETKQAIAAAPAAISWLND